MKAKGHTGSHVGFGYEFPRVYVILETVALSRLDFNPADFASALLDGGARILQFRHKGFWSRQVFAQAGEVARLCREARASFILNDRADYAALLDAGVHLGQEDLLPADARSVIGKRPIGYSTHNAGQMVAAGAEPVDYLAFGPVFPTASKERPDPVTGLESLGQVRALTDKPLVAIGGITLENAPMCWGAGADSVAVISGLLPSPCTPRAVRDRMEEWLRLRSH